MTAEGRFASQLAFDITTVPEAGGGREVERALTKIVEAAPGWSAIAGGRLAFKTKLQLKALKGLGTAPLSGDDRKLLGLATPPKTAALVACAKGCAALIRSGQIAKSAGKKEAQIIIEAAANADPQLGKILTVALASAAAGKGTMEDVAKFIFGEMKKNIGDPSTVEMISLNRAFERFDSIDEVLQSIVDSFDLAPIAKAFLSGQHSPVIEAILALPRKAQAYDLWIEKVAARRPWDFKTSQPKKVDPDGRGFVIDPQTSRNFRVDIWANIHYGYVGRAAGFSSQELTSGAGIAQILTIVSQLKDGKVRPLVESLTRFADASAKLESDLLAEIDDPIDRAAVELGIRLWDQSGASLTLQQFVDAVRSNASLLGA